MLTFAALTSLTTQGHCLHGDDPGARAVLLQTHCDGARLPIMRFYGRQVSKWWLFLLLPIAMLGALMLPLLFFAGNNFAGAIIGPPAIWNRPIHAPAQADLVGRYVETKRTWERDENGPKAVLELKSDGTMTVRALPDDRITSLCTLSGSGTWKADGQVINLDFISDGTPGACESASMGGNPQITGRSKPYELYWILGDPDSGTGIWLKRQ